MATFDSISEARALATPVHHYIASDEDTGPWMVVQYVPTLGTGGAAATIAVAAGGDTITFLVDSASAAGADAIGGSDSIILTTESTFDTMGELVDQINATRAWRAYLVGALRADDAGDILTKSAASAIGDNGLTFYADASDGGDVGCSIAISGEKFVNNGKNGHVTDWDSQCENSMIYGSFNVTCASAPILQYYSGKQGSTETQIGEDILLTSGTAKEQGEADKAGAFISATRGHRLVIRCVGASSAAITAATIAVTGKTAVLDGSRLVNEDNY